MNVVRLTEVHSLSLNLHVDHSIYIPSLSLQTLTDQIFKVGSNVCLSGPFRIQQKPHCNRMMFSYADTNRHELIFMYESFILKMRQVHY